MSTSVEDLEKRVEAVERLLQNILRKDAAGKRSKDWRRTVGMFAGDSLMAEIFERGRQIREAEREEARKQ